MLSGDYSDGNEDRPKKRPRSQSPCKNIAKVEGTDTQSLQHDNDYYFEDGSAVLRVDNVLFKVHRTILSKDSSTFETMFRLPCGEGTQTEGGRDTNPIILQGDTPEQFRSLLWALYAMPHEIINAGSTNIQGDWPHFDRFCDLVLMVHKYNFKNLESWALRAFLQWLAPASRHPPPRIHSSIAMSLTCTCTGSGMLERLRRVLELAVLCDDQTLHEAVVHRLQDALRGPDADLPWFIALGERFTIPSLTGAAYNALMLKGRDKWISLVSEGQLSRAQLARLHAGYYALVSQWDAYRVSPPVILPCTHYGHCCRQRWHAYWKELSKDDVIMSKFPADVVGKLETMLSRVYAYTGIMDMHQECRTRALGAVKLLIKETKESMAAHFVDLP